ncbi:MAG TPA: universal stress protein [Ktedonobacteraceae bacterium]|nr:universal stress protein [Ktedonobacteraceae bacterium]
MKKRILLGVDAPLSPATRQALRAISAFVVESTSQISLVLLHVIPIPTITSPTFGVYGGHSQSLEFTNEQRERGELALRMARALLQDEGIPSHQIELMLRQGTPTEEVVKVAKELPADMIVIGSRGNSPRQRLRRIFAGSVSRRILTLASCPVTIVVPPAPTPHQHPHDLVKWYETSITHYLAEHTGDLTVFTPQEVTRTFAPPYKKEPGRKERAAAILALEQLASSGILCRHDVKGELRYVND